MTTISFEWESFVATLPLILSMIFILIVTWQEYKKKTKRKVK